MEHSESPEELENVHLLNHDGREIYLVGTAHVSAKSAELVETVLRQVQPDTVAVELCQPRYRALKNPEQWKQTDILQVIKQGKAYLLLAQLLLSGFQRKIGKKLGVKPGAEMLKAVEVADELGAETVMADREVSITLRRTWSNLGFWSGIKLVASLAYEGVLGETEELGEEEIERLKTADVLEEAMQDFAKAMPQVRESLIDERDRYLASKIASSPGQKVVAVVGAGHVPGITEYLGDDIDILALEEIPPPSPWGKILGWGIPLAILSLIIYGLMTAGTEVGGQMLLDWLWVNAAFGGLGSLMALAHPVTIIVAFLVSPFTSANPMIAAGWVAGLVEATIRKPRVEDFEDLGAQPLTFRLFWRNRVTRVLLVMLLTNLMGGLGTFLSGGLIASRLPG